MHHQKKPGLLILTPEEVRTGGTPLPSICAAPTEQPYLRLWLVLPLLH